MFVRLNGDKIQKMGDKLEKEGDKNEKISDKLENMSDKVEDDKISEINFLYFRAKSNNLQSNK